VAGLRSAGRGAGLFPPAGAVASEKLAGHEKLHSNHYRPHRHHQHHRRDLQRHRAALCSGLRSECAGGGAPHRGLAALPGRSAGAGHLEPAAASGAGPEGQRLRSGRGAGRPERVIRHRSGDSSGAACAGAGRLPEAYGQCCLQDGQSGGESHCQ